MNSSDDEWQNPHNFLAERTITGKGTDDSMLARRRMAMQQQRGGVALGPSQTLQATQQAAPVEKNLLVSPQHQKQQQTGTTEDTLESLRRELEAKKKLLAAAKSKEDTLRDWWRAQKVQRLAEIAQLDAKLRQQEEAMEEMKAVAERKVREAEDRQQERLKEERNKIEATIREEYEPQIAAQRAKLEELQKEEARLQAELSVGDTVKDVVHKCVGSALLTILQRVEEMFSTDAETIRSWEEEVERLIRHEVRSSFAVTTDSEAQREREDYRKYFQELLNFWRQAEEEEREHVLKIDEQMLLDMQSMVHDDLDRLQREELSMEEMYVESREAWASQHQEMLKRELDASVSRRATELEEQRALRHQLHLERMKAMEEKYHDMLEKQRWFHEKRMALLREQHAKEERLTEQQTRIMAATQTDVSRATEEFNRIVHSVENLLGRMKEYRAAIDDGRIALDVDRRRALETQEATLNMVKDVVTNQTVSIGEEYNSLSATLSKLEVVRRTVEQHLEDERLWLGKQEAKFANDKTEWEREHRRWKQMVEDEKCHVQERFGRLLSELRGATEELADEERQAKADSASILSGIHAVNEVATTEVRKLRQREEDLKERHDAMVRLLTDMQSRSELVERQWRQLRHERQKLTEEKEALREDEGQLRQTDQYLRLLQTQLSLPPAETLKGHEQKSALQHGLHVSQEVNKNLHMLQAQAQAKAKRRKQIFTQLLRRKEPTPTENTDRLPLRVLQELREMLGKDSQHPNAEVGADAHQNLHEKSPQHIKRPSQEQHHRYTDPANGSGETSTHLYDSSNYNFTCLLNFSDADSTLQTFHNSV